MLRIIRSSSVNNWFSNVNNSINCYSLSEIETVCAQGCTEVTACNYNPNATESDDSCIYASGCDVCDGEGGITDNPEIGDNCDDGNTMTIDDMIQEDCSCTGTTILCMNLLLVQQLSALKNTGFTIIINVEQAGSTPTLVAFR